MKRVSLLLVALFMAGCNKENLFMPEVAISEKPGHPSPPAHGGRAEYRFVIGTPSLAAMGFTDADPVRSTASSNGDSILIRGEGTFTIKNNDKGKASGSGSFVHKNSAGRVLGIGTWTAERLSSFESYGSAIPQGAPPAFEGGLAVMRVHLSPLNRDAVLRVESRLGEPPAGAHHGVRLAVERGPNFDHEVSGATIFIRTN